MHGGTAADVKLDVDLRPPSNSIESCFRTRTCQQSPKGKRIKKRDPADREPLREQSLKVGSLKQQIHHGLFPGAGPDDGLVEGKGKVTGRESGEGD